MSRMGVTVSSIEETFDDHEQAADRLADLNLLEMILDCTATARVHGFNLTQHGTQVAMMATETAEALAHITDVDDYEVRQCITGLMHVCSRLEAYRRTAQNYRDQSVVRNWPELLEELADQVIRVFSYVGGNGQADAFIDTLQRKMDENVSRPILHGKGF